MDTGVTSLAHRSRRSFGTRKGVLTLQTQCVSRRQGACAGLQATANTVSIRSSSSNSAATGHAGFFSVTKGRSFDIFPGSRSRPRTRTRVTTPSWVEAALWKLARLPSSYCICLAGLHPTRRQHDLLYRPGLLHCGGSRRGPVVAHVVAPPSWPSGSCDGRRTAPSVRLVNTPRTALSLSISSFASSVLSTKGWARSASCPSNSEVAGFTEKKQRNLVDNGV
ncbi:hypothetical protein CDD83_8595 [Cordyceps sp. RAO-2017]|nr:hypothetical protein CDD83_8595 [Cordyceps sp. RAO-2017]